MQRLPLVFLDAQGRDREPFEAHGSGGSGSRGRLNHGISDPPRFLPKPAGPLGPG
jgi:hypothetical protein